MSSKIMAHMVPYFPDLDRSLAVARGLIQGGAATLELQFPFSDPTADGPAIQAACQVALRNGFTVDKGFAFVKAVVELTGELERELPVYIMSYASLVVARGVRRFLEDGIAAGAAGFILPDLPMDYDEGVFAAARELGTTVMPVLVAGADRSRVELLKRAAPTYVYVALRRGITGSHTEVGSDNLAFLDTIVGTGIKVMAGFGISARDQVVALEPHVDSVVIGSALVNTVHAKSDCSADEICLALSEQMTQLRGG